MADAAAARREARRRKILENSHNRLQIISGKSNDECHKESPIRTVIPEPDYDIPAPVSSSSRTAQQPNGVLFSPPELPTELFELLSATHDIDASGDGEVVSDLAPLLPPTALVPPALEPVEVPTLSLWEKITTYKYDIVLLSLLLQILYSLSLITFESGYFFLPVIVYIITKLTWFSEQSSSNVTSLLMLLATNGMSPVRVQRILRIAQCFAVVSRDVFVYLFTTISVQSLWILLRDNVVT